MEKHLSRVADQFFNAQPRTRRRWVGRRHARLHATEGFDVTSIRVPTAVKFGRTDNLVPAAHGDWLAAHIPNVIVDAHDAAGHAGDDAEVERVFAWIAGEVEDLSAAA